MKLNEIDFQAKKYPDSSTGVAAMLRDEADPAFVRELDLDNCVFQPDPQADGVWAVDNHATGVRVIVYLAGYREPMGDIREYNDFEDGEIPERELLSKGMDIYRLTTKPEELDGFEKRGDTFKKMRRDKMSEAKKLAKTQRAAIPDMERYPGLSGNNPYLQYRFGVAMAGSPKGEKKMHKTGPTADDFVTIGYTDVDRSIIDGAKKILGQKSTKVSSLKSQETPGVNKQSPVKPQPPIKPKKKVKEALDLFKLHNDPKKLKNFKNKKEILKNAENELFKKIEKWSGHHDFAYGVIQKNRGIITDVTLRHYNSEEDIEIEIYIEKQPGSPYVIIQCPHCDYLEEVDVAEVFTSLDEILEYVIDDMEFPD